MKPLLRRTLAGKSRCWSENMTRSESWVLGELPLPLKGRGFLFHRTKLANYTRNLIQTRGVLRRGFVLHRLRIPTLRRYFLCPFYQDIYSSIPIPVNLKTALFTFVRSNALIHFFYFITTFGTRLSRSVKSVHSD